MLPDYLPNVHPIVVHFPIVLLLLGVAADALSLALGSRRGLRDLATVLLLIGALSLIPTYLAGREAADQVVSPFVRTDAVLSEHADAAWLTLWAFLVAAAMRVALIWRGRLSGALHGLLVVVGAGGLFLLYETAEHGGQLVYDLGVGVRPVKEAPEGAFDPPPALDLDAVGPVVDNDGTFRWRFVAGSEAVAPEYLTPIVGVLPSATMQTRQSALVLDVRAGEPVLLTFGQRVADVRVGALLNLDGFEGTVALLHHVAGPDTYDSMVAGTGPIRLERHRPEGGSRLGDPGTTWPRGWHLLEVVGAGGHFRGYLDGEMIVHGHAEEGEPGRPGLLLDGSGQVRIDDLRAQPLQE